MRRQLSSNFSLLYSWLVQHELLIFVASVTQSAYTTNREKNSLKENAMKMFEMQYGQIITQITVKKDK